MNQDTQLKNKADYLYSEIEKASNDIKKKFPRTRRKAWAIKVITILMSTSITLINGYNKFIEWTLLLSSMVTFLTSIDALLGFSKKATQEHEYYHEVEILRVEVDMYRQYSIIEDVILDEYFQKYESLRRNFHNGRIDSIRNSFENTNF